MWELGRCCDVSSLGDEKEISCPHFYDGSIVQLGGFHWKHLGRHLSWAGIVVSWCEVYVAWAFARYTNVPPKALTVESRRTCRRRGPSEG